MAIKTVHLTNAYHPTSGGVRTFYHALLAAANAGRRLMRLIVPGEDDRVEECGPYGRIYTVRARRAPAFDRRYRLLLPSAYLPPTRSRLCEILTDEQPDLLEICDKYALPYVAALIRKDWMPSVPRPTLVGLSCERMDDNVAAYLSRSQVARRLARLYIRRIYGPPFDVHVANSEYTAAELREALWDRPPDFIHVSPMGVDFQAFGPVHRDRALRRRLLQAAGGDDASVLLLYAGRLSPEKNVQLLVEMMACLARPVAGHVAPSCDFRLVLAGAGPMADRLTSLAARIAPGRVRLLGPITDRAELAALYASADVFVHPNPREPFGIAPLEAMASRVPVVLPAVGGVLAYATSDNAWLAAPDARAFAFAVRSVVLCPDPARLAAARDTALAHDWSRMASRHLRMLDQLHLARTGAASRRSGGGMRSGSLSPPATRLRALPA